ncbi:hypothetical protein NIES593_08960 [Hydrococcus rivularis NIES-593]|uniref:Uncharacterized protein n=1 Tax=Hydrococcus rivularis NIES-593 TaxID=1921803 RepID=A0A1U7HJR6_9CYAN|nr:hypothetical protein [Hydrococcus rivularis]OKH23778.1 hypothetical protein NIES593_08960 [Hydrococcus rivularis NIES-593]
MREKKDWLQSPKYRIDARSFEHEYIIKPDEPFPSYQIQAKRLTEAKKENEELKSVNAQVLQQFLRNLEKSFENIRARNFGFLRFKNSAGMRSFVFPQLKKFSKQAESSCFLGTSDSKLMARPKFFKSLHRKLKLLVRLVLRENPN